ncbi:MAG TPA: hypothetical protein PKA64_09270 [Myxococcota bacterium]|nr:hypothetical protein [Myxococcota bacterium]
MDREALVNAVTSPLRERGADGAVRAHPSWHDLDAAGRIEAFDATVLSRLLEAALDPDGLSGTARAVLARIRR